MEKRERNLIYKKALKAIEDHIDSYVCNTILGIVDFKYNVDEIIFPELFIFKDESCYGAWLSDKTPKANFSTCSDTIEGRLTREIVLEFCILMTEE